mgnify:CR=1 FL=1
MVDSSPTPMTKNRRIPLKRRKITLPPFNDKLLPRAQLVERLNDALERRLTVIAAPPGSGKTELIQLWRHQHPEIPLAWYNLDSSDNNFADFSRYLTQTVTEATGTQQLTLSPTSEDLEHLTEHFQDEQTKLIICLDNFHEISCPHLLKALEACITDPFSRAHWLILSQQQPALNLTELHLKDEWLELGSSELNFTVAEIAELSHDRKLPANDVAAIFDSTQGWIAGVNLSLATQPQKALQTNQPSQKAVDLFQHLALNELPQSVFKLIQSASICNPINIDLADHIGNNNSSQEAVDYLVKNCLFIQPLDQQENWFHIHPLFFFALKKELQKDDQRTRNEKHSRAGEWLIEHQIYEQGLEHLLLSKDAETFDRHLTSISEEWLLNGNLEEPNRWCAQVDSDRLFGNPKLFLQYLFSLTLSFHVSEARQLLKTYDQFQTKSDDTLSVARQLISAFTLDAQLASAEDNEKSRQHLLLKSDKTALENFALGTITNLSSLSAYLSLNMSEAKALAQEGRRYHRLANSVHGESYSEYIGSAAQFSMGPNKVESALHLEAFAVAKHLQQSQPCYILMCVATAPIYYELNQHQQAYKYFQTISDEISSETYLEVAIFYHLTYAKLLHREGKGDQADRLLGEMLNHTSASHSPRAVTMVAFERLRQAMIDRDPQRATQLRDQFFHNQSNDTAANSSPTTGDDTEDNDLQNWGLTLLVDSIHHHANGRFTEANNVLGQITETLSLGENRYVSAIVSALEISANWKNDQQTQALTQLCQLIETLNQQGYYCLLRDYIVDLDDMIEKLGDRIPRFLHADFINDLQLNTPTTNNKTSLIQPLDSRPLLEPLTKRELVLLIDISQGLSNQEVSDKRFVAISTVKWHLKNIYAKLDAKHRAQAIARARELNIIE